MATGQQINDISKYPDFLTETGYGTGDGLCGWNCRHSFQPWMDGLRNPYRDEDGNLILGDGEELTPEENERIYQNQQKQRSMERSIRKTKRCIDAKSAEIEAVTDPSLKQSLVQDKDRLEARLLSQNAAYNQFCAEHDLVPQYTRTRVAGEVWRATGR